MPRNSFDANLWWEQAQADLETAFINYQNERFDASVFYSQQSVEKALKAIIIGKKKEMPPRVHQLFVLSKIIMSDEDVKKIESWIKKVEPGYILARYPEPTTNLPPSKAIGKKRAEEIYDAAERILSWLIKNVWIKM